METWLHTGSKAKFSKEHCNTPLLSYDLGPVSIPQGPAVAEACIVTTEAVHSEWKRRQGRLASHLPNQSSHHPDQVRTTSLSRVPLQHSPSQLQSRLGTNAHQTQPHPKESNFPPEQGKERAHSIDSPCPSASRSPSTAARACSCC